MNKYIHAPRGVVSNEVLCVGRFTIVHLKDDKDRESIGVSRCSNSDVFSKELGVNIARGRAEKALRLVKRGKSIRNIFMG